MSFPNFEGPVHGTNVVAGVQAQGGGTIHFNFGTNTQPRAIRPFSTIPFPPDPKFVQRPDIVLWLQDRTTQTGSRAALVGLGGIGKSQVAISYAHQVRLASPDTFVFWVHASSKARFEEAYRTVADKLQLPGRDDPKRNVLQLVYTWLCDEENGPWMMVLDNADLLEVFFLRQGEHSSNDQPLASFLPKTGRGSIIITSRNTDAAQRLAGHDAIYKVPTMDKGQALELFRNRLGGEVSGEECGDDYLAATDLVSALDYMPLAITQAAAYIKRRTPRMSIPAYLVELRRSDKKKANLLNKDGGDLRRDDGASNSIITTWQITFEQIRCERPSAADLLSFMSFFNPQGIPEFVLQAYVRDSNQSTENDLDGEIDHEHDEDAEDDLDEDLEVLCGYSLVAVTAKSNIFEMHALVQFCTQVWLSTGNIQRWKRQFLKIISDQYPSGEYENWTICKSLDPHIEAIIRYNPGIGEDALAWATLLTNVGWYRWREGIYKQAMEMNQHSLDIRERVLGRQHQDTLLNVHILALVLRAQGKYKDAEQMHRRALDAREIVLGREHPDTLTSVNNLALVLRNQGKYKDAEQMHRRALDACEIVLGREHPDTLTSVNNLASVLQNQGKYKDAEQMHRRALDASEIVFSREHPDTLRSVNNLASVLQAQGKYKDAEQMHRRALDACEIVLGREHPNTLISVSNLALVLQAQGKYKDAEQMHRRALDACEIVLGREHPDTLTSVNNLASVLQNQGKYKDAEQMHRRALDASEIVFSREHPDTLRSVNNLASVLQAQGKYKDAEQMHRRALDACEIVLGREHPNTLISVSNLALVLQAQGKYKDAEQMHRRALDVREIVLGREHPDTLRSVGNLALVLQAQGKYKDAEQMHRRALDAREIVLGREHPDTLLSIHHLAYLFHQQKRFSEAALLYERAYDGYMTVLGSNHPHTTACMIHYRSLQEDVANYT